MWDFLHGNCFTNGEWKLNISSFKENGTFTGSKNVRLATLLSPRVSLTKIQTIKDKIDVCLQNYFSTLEIVSSFFETF